MGTQFQRTGGNLNTTETTEGLLGTIQVPPGASKITGISAACALPTGTATEGPVGRARLGFAKCEELSGIPVDITGIVDVVGAGYYQPEMIKCDIGVEALVKISCYMTLSKAQTVTPYGQICLRFE